MNDHVRDMSLIRENELLKQKIQWNYQRLARMEVREATFRSEIDVRDGQIASLVSDLGQRDNFIQRLMRELSRHGWGDMHYTPGWPQQDPSIVALLEEGGFQYDRDSKPESTQFEAAEGYRIEFGDGTVIESQEGNIYERGSDKSRTSPEAAGT